MVTLSADQRHIVEAPFERHLLVTAGPGSGKTRLVVERIRHLTLNGIVPPEKVVALAFTNRASLEINTRLAEAGVHGVTTSTIHSYCARILERNWQSVGMEGPFLIAGTDEQERLLSAAHFDVTGRMPTEESVHWMLLKVSNRTSSGVPVGNPWTWGDGRLSDDSFDAIYDRYRHVLHAAGLLDFDGLITGAIEVLGQDELAVIERNMLGAMFVDEVHDLSNDQFRLIELLAPPRAPARLMAVGDLGQAIYGWRGADAEEVFREIRQRYSPVDCTLRTNYRSTPEILSCACSASGQKPLAMARKTGTLPRLLGFDNEKREAQGIVALAQAVVADGGSFSDVAVLVRSHWRAVAIEAALVGADIAVERTSPDRFFERPMVRETLRYLDVLMGMHERSLQHVLAWPRMVVDELAMLQVRQMVRRAGVTLGDVVGNPNLLAAELTPLTRQALQSFHHEVVVPIRPHLDVPMVRISEQLMPLVAQRRNMVPKPDKKDFDDTRNHLRVGLDPLRAALWQALQQDRSIALDAVGGNDDMLLDQCCAHAVFSWMMGEYLGLEVAPAGTPGALTVLLGGEGDVTGDVVPLGPRLGANEALSTTARCWRLCQLVMLDYESVDVPRYVSIDVETTGINLQTAELVEVSAVLLDLKGGIIERYTRLVRPSSEEALPLSATRVHGITWDMVKDAAGPQEVLGGFIRFVGQYPVIGHNLETFDLPVLRRAAKGAGMELPAWEVVDTLPLARRLLDLKSYKLEAIAADYDRVARQALESGKRQYPGWHYEPITPKETHRAEPDAILAALVFRRLALELKRQRGEQAMLEALPLVAVAQTPSGFDRLDGEYLVRAGGTGWAMGVGKRLAALAVADPTVGGLVAERLEIIGGVGQMHLKDDREWTDFRRIWMSTVADCARTTGDPSLHRFLHYAQLASEMHGVIHSDGRVTIMTAHSAKGREWPTVIVAGCEDQSYPGHSRDQAVQDEARRLLYVAMTRAQDHLVLTHCGLVGEREGSVSRFLRDIAMDVLAREDGLAEKKPQKAQ